MLDEKDKTAFGADTQTVEYNENTKRLFSFSKPLDEPLTANKRLLLQWAKYVFMFPVSRYNRMQQQLYLLLI